MIDRSLRTALYLFGVPQILLGLGLAFAGAMTAMIRLGAALVGAPPGPNGLLPLVLGLWFLAGGLGLVRARRWAWAMALFQDFFLVVFGYFALVWALEWTPDLLWLAPTGSREAARALAGRWWAYAFNEAVPAVIGLVQIVVLTRPRVSALFFGNGDSAATPPVGVLVFCAYLAFCFAMGMTELFDPRAGADFFGSRLEGSLADARNALDLALLAWLIVGFYRRESSSWWGLILLNLVWTVSGALTNLFQTLPEHFRNSTLALESLSLIPDPVFLTPAVTTMGMLLLTVVEYGYLFWIKKYFDPPRAGSVSS